MDLSTRYLGLALRSPLLAAASPLSRNVDGVRRLADAGVGAVVLHSLFEEQLRHEAEQNARLAVQGSETYAESLSYFPSGVGGGYRANRYLHLLESAASAVDIPVIGSLNGITPDGWVRYASSMQNAGAAAIELNIYYLPGDPQLDGPQVEQRYLDVLAHVKAEAKVPVAVKLSPFFSSMGEMAQRLDQAGADGLVLFNRFVQPDINCETLMPASGVPLSTAAEIRLPLTWIALLSGRLRGSLAGSTGVVVAADVVKYLLAGADVVQSASALLRHGPEYAGVLLDGLRDWMLRKGFNTLDGVRGMLAVHDDGSARERGEYVSALRDANSSAYDFY